MSTTPSPYPSASQKKRVIDITAAMSLRWLPDPFFDTSATSCDLASPNVCCTS